MDEKHRLLTEAIVGGPRRYDLGVPTREAVDESPEGTRIDLFAKLSALASRWGAHPSRMRAEPRVSARSTYVVLSAVGTLLAGAAGGIYLRPTATMPVAVPSYASAPSGQLPLLPAGASPIPAQSPSAIEISGGAYFPPTTAVAPHSAVDRTPAIPAASTQLKLAPPAPAAPSAMPSKVRASEPVEPKAALVIDAPASARGHPAGANVISQVPAPAASSSRLVGPARESAPSVSGAALLKVTLVDVDKSGKFALITNPQTRLPEKVVPGQKIFTGETVKSIDGSAGTLHLDNRTITLQ